jgi:hypothetical protein
MLGCRIFPFTYFCFGPNFSRIPSYVNSFHWNEVCKLIISCNANDDKCCCTTFLDCLPTSRSCSYLSICNSLFLPFTSMHDTQRLIFSNSPGANEAKSESDGHFLDHFNNKTKKLVHPLITNKMEI